MDAVRRFNERLGTLVTRGVGTMWCAYAFAALALTSLPQNLDTAQHFILWASSTFLQLVLLSVLMVGQGISGRSTDQAIQSILRDVSDMIQPVKDNHDQLAVLVGEIHAHHFGKADPND